MWCSIQCGSALIGEECSLKQGKPSCAHPWLSKTRCFSWKPRPGFGALLRAALGFRRRERKLNDTRSLQRSYPVSAAHRNEQSPSETPNTPFSCLCHSLRHFGPRTNFPTARKGKKIKKSETEDRLNQQRLESFSAVGSQRGYRAHYTSTLPERDPDALAPEPQQSARCVLVLKQDGVSPSGINLTTFQEV